MDYSAGSQAADIANARLIAEAPAMFKALEDCLNTIKALDENYDERESYIAGCAALNKATGGK
jgi:hypothetical protein